LSADGLYRALGREPAKNLDGEFGAHAADDNEPLEEPLLFRIEKTVKGDLIFAHLGVDVQRGLGADRGQRSKRGNGDDDVVAHAAGFDNGLAGLLEDELAAQMSDHLQLIVESRFGRPQSNGLSVRSRCGGMLDCTAVHTAIDRCEVHCENQGGLTMPLPNDERVVALANDLLQVFDQMFGLHPGYRAAHAKGTMLTGHFTPSPAAQQLSRAAHFTRQSTPVTVRFSDSTGLPQIPDSAPEANPRGMAIRFHLAEHVHTDIVSHSVNGFPARDGYQFLEFLRAAIASGPDVPSPKPVEKFLGSHPAALAFVQAPKPFPVSLAQETYYAVTAYAFTNASGVTKYGRYRMVPELGNKYFADGEAATLSQNYHFDELLDRVEKSPIRFKMLVQVAADGDVTDDATVQWPASRELVEVGTIELVEAVKDNAAEQKQLIFDPIPRTDGIEASADPLLELRAAIYLLSGRRRRAAKLEEAQV
jgi:catalase